MLIPVEARSIPGAGKNNILSFSGSYLETRPSWEAESVNNVERHVEKAKHGQDSLNQALAG
jgi:hypothetical protein